MNLYFDSSVLVAAAIRDHPHNPPALDVLNRLVDGGHRGFVSAHGLTEVYSVLTRAPFKPPVYPSEALRIIENQILQYLELVSLDPQEYIGVLRRTAEAGWIGGRIHDVVHLECARKAACDRVYTFKLSDFRKIATDDLVDRISSP